MERDLAGARTDSFQRRLPLHSRRPQGAPLRLRIFHPEQLVWQAAAKLPMQPQDVGKRCRKSRIISALVDGLLDLDMRNRLKLQGAPGQFGGVSIPGSGVFPGFNNSQAAL